MVTVRPDRPRRVLWIAAGLTILCVVAVIEHTDVVRSRGCTVLVLHLGILHGAAAPPYMEHIHDQDVRAS